MAWIVSEGEPARLFSIGGSTFVTEWDLSTCLPIANYQANAGVIWSLAASPDNKSLAVGCEDGSVILLDVSGGRGVIEQQRILQRQTSRVLSISWAGNDKIVGGLADARISVWSTRRETNGKILATVKVDKSKQRESTLVWSIKVVSDKIFVSGDSTGSVKFWDLQKFSLLQSFSGHDADVLCLTSDVSGKTVYSAGVDRKIMCYQVVNKTSGRWASMGSNMVHGHDVRAMALHESAPNTNFLVSGGVERTLVINDLNDFMFGNNRKLPITPQNSCVSTVSGKRLLVMWDGQTVKIWYVGELQRFGDENSQLVAVPAQGKKLVCCMTLASDENITCASLSSDGKLLAISTIAETKLFKLTQVASNKKKDRGMPLTYRVTKLASHDLEEQGARHISIIERNGAFKLLVTSPESDLILYDLKKDEESGEYGLDLDSDPAELQVRHSELKEQVKSTSTTINYLDSISHVSVSPNSRYVAASRFSGVIDLYDIADTFDSPEKIVSNESEEEDGAVVDGIILGNFTGLPTALSFTAKDTLVIVTAEVRVFEYSLHTQVDSAGTSIASRTKSRTNPTADVDEESHDSQIQAKLTQWSRTNSSLLPTELTDARDKCRGIFYDPSKPQRLWLWAGTWLAFLDTSVDFPVKRVPKRLANGSGKVSGDDLPNSDKKHNSKFQKQKPRRILPALGLEADGDSIMADDDDTAIEEVDEKVDEESKEQQKPLRRSSRRKSKYNGSANTSQQKPGVNGVGAAEEGEAAEEIDDSVSVLGRRAFWITYKYRPLLYADTFGSGEMIIVERPLMDLKLPPAFWSNKKISF